MDYIGVSAYYEPGKYVDGNNPQALEGYWASIDQNELLPLSQKFNKPLIFTEVGYRNISGTTVDPWNFSRGGEPNEGEQKAAYEGLFGHFEEADHLAGIHLWDWSSDPNACGSGNFDYTYCGKLAQEVVKQYYSGTGGNIEPLPELPVDDTTVNPPVEEENETPEENPIQEPNETPEDNNTEEPPQESEAEEFSSEDLAFGIKVGSTVETLIAGQSTGFTATVQNQSGFDVANINADFEIYDESGKRVFQLYDEDLNLANEDSIEYELDFVPETAGKYTLKMGAFSSDWSKLHLWIDDLLPFTVYNISEVDENGEELSEEEVNSQEKTLKIWWPSNGSAVNGVQPFKGMVEGLGLDQYNMYWQVDGDGENLMENSNEEYPHKHASVDLSNWNWNQSGTYQLTFIAKNLTGEVIDQSNIEISVAN
ncbi:hypothetical protein HC766_01210 [Candidatus Gracilibacteria bacterium]|nr:hypothetical protein [Candidatus Gracilibacteria bacterium]